jgi:hypothetical protein
MIPHRGQVSEAGSKSPSSEHWRVFHEREAGSYFTDDSCHFHPESASLPGDSFTAPCGADVLTGETSRHHVNTSAPWLPVECAYVIPDRERGEASVVLSGDQNIPCVGVSLDGADGFPSEQLAAEYASTSACEKCQLM